MLGQGVGWARPSTHGCMGEPDLRLIRPDHRNLLVHMGTVTGRGLVLAELQHLLAYLRAGSVNGPGRGPQGLPTRL